MDLKTISLIAGIGSTVVPGIFWVYNKKIKPAIKRKKEKKERMQIELEQLLKMREQIEFMYKQFHNNGGHTVMDKLDKLNKGQEEFEMRMDSYEDRQKFLLNMQNIAFFLCDEKGEWTYVSPALCRMVKRSESELNGNGWLSCLSKRQHNQDRVDAEWASSIEDKRTFDEVFYFQGGNNELIMVNGLAFHSNSKKKNTYTGSYGTLTLVSQ